MWEKVRSPQGIHSPDITVCFVCSPAHSRQHCSGRLLWLCRLAGTAVVGETRAEILQRRSKRSLAMSPAGAALGGRAPAVVADCPDSPQSADSPLSSPLSPVFVLPVPISPRFLLLFFHFFFLGLLFSHTTKTIVFLFFHKKISPSSQLCTPGHGLQATRAPPVWLGLHVAFA